MVKSAQPDPSRPKSRLRSDVTRCFGRERRGAASQAEVQWTIAMLAGAYAPPEKQRQPHQRFTEHVSTLTRAQIMRAVVTAMDRQPSQLQQAIERLVARPEVVPLLANPAMGARPERRLARRRAGCVAAGWLPGPRWRPDRHDQG